MSSITLKVRWVREVDVPGLAERIKAAAEASEKSIASICREIGIKTPYWYSVVNGNRKSVRFDTLLRICKAVGLDPAEIGVSFDLPDAPSAQSPAPSIATEDEAQPVADEADDENLDQPATEG